MVAMAEKANVTLPELSDAQTEEVCPELGADWREVFDLDRAFSRREKPGMPGPKQIASRISHWENLLG